MIAITLTNSIGLGLLKYYYRKSSAQIHAQYLSTHRKTPDTAALSLTYNFLRIYRNSYYHAPN